MDERRRIILSEILELQPYTRHDILFSDDREYWVHPINVHRNRYGEFHHLMPELKRDPDRFHSYFRMFPSTFSTILAHVEADLTKQHSGYREPISAEERLALTLRYLSTGMSYRSLAHSYRMGKSTVSKIIEETVTVLWANLSPLFVKEPTKDLYMDIADKYLNICNFPNVIGAIDGKHIRIEAPANSGSNYFNYKHYFSIVLQGVADPDLKFISVEVGAYGKESDGGIFSRSKIKAHVEANTAGLPPSAGLQNSNIHLQYFLIGDAAYPLKHYLMTPIKSNLTHDRKIFNYRLSRARRCVECAFGVLAAKWRVLKTAMLTQVDNAINITLATVALHNAIIEIEGLGSQEQEHEVWDDALVAQVGIIDRRVEGVQYQGRPGQYATWMREQLVQYFVGPGAVAWQENYV